MMEAQESPAAIMDKAMSVAPRIDARDGAS